MLDLKFFLIQGTKIVHFLPCTTYINNKEISNLTMGGVFKHRGFLDDIINGIGVQISLNLEAFSQIVKFSCKSYSRCQQKTMVKATIGIRL